MDTDRIYAKLQEIVNQKGGKISRAELKKYIPDLINEYKEKDDQSLDFDKLRISVMDQIAGFLYGTQYTTLTSQADKIRIMQTIPEATINKVMNKLSKARELDINEQEKEYSDRFEALEEQEKTEKLTKRSQALKSLSKVDAVKLLKEHSLYPPLPALPDSTVLKSDDLKALIEGLKTRKIGFGMKKKAKKTNKSKK